MKISQSLGLYVILRPSPYICAGWDFEGLPYWLLKDDSMIIRSTYNKFLEAVDDYYSELFKYIVPLQITNSGPVIIMQLENEYGSFGNDKKYLKAIKDLMIKHGSTVPLFTSDGGWQEALDAGVLLNENILPTANFGFYNGTNFYDSIAPQITSYDYDALLTEWGIPTEKYYEFKNVISNFKSISDFELSTKIDFIHYRDIKLTNKVSFYFYITLVKSLGSVRKNLTEPNLKIKACFCRKLYNAPNLFALFPYSHILTNGLTVASSLLFITSSSFLLTSSTAISSPLSYNSNALIPLNSSILIPFLSAIAFATAKVDHALLQDKYFLLTTSISIKQYPNSPPCLCIPV